jgi:ABC-2 type transport system ATP-binding protein
LKAQLGGAMLEARVSDPSDLDRAAALLAEVGHAQPRIDRDQQLVSIPSAGGTTLLLAVGRSFEDEHVALDDLGNRRPSLDDVFLSLTGAPASANADTASAQEGPRQQANAK